MDLSLLSVSGAVPQMHSLGSHRPYNWFIYKELRPDLASSLNETAVPPAVL